MEPDYAALAAAVAMRRKVLGLTQSSLARRGGPAKRTVYRIESSWYANHGGEMSHATLDALDTALQWSPGSASRVLYYHDRPLPIEQATPSDAERLSQYRDWSHALHGAAASLDKGDLGGATDDLRKVAAELDQVVDAATRADEQRRKAAQADAFTDILQQLRADGKVLSPVMETAFGEFLVHPPGEIDEDVSYRRWLLGRDQVTPEQETAFHQRYVEAVGPTPPEE